MTWVRLDHLGFSVLAFPNALCLQKAQIGLAQASFVMDVRGKFIIIALGIISPAAAGLRRGVVFLLQIGVAVDTLMRLSLSFGRSGRLFLAGFGLVLVGIDALLLARHI